MIGGPGGRVRSGRTSLGKELKCQMLGIAISHAAGGWAWHSSFARLPYFSAFCLGSRGLCRNRAQGSRAVCRADLVFGQASGRSGARTGEHQFHPRSSCVGCDICAEVWPPGVLKVEIVTRRDPQESALVDLL